MKKNIIALFVFLFPGLFIFFPYLTGKRLFVFIDVGQDFLLNLWPLFLHVSSLLKSGVFPVYSMSLGFGTNIFAGSLIRTSIVDPFALILLLFPQNLFLPLIPWILLSKIVISAFLFYYFLMRIKLSYSASVLGGLLFSYSSQMIIRMGWHHYSTEMILIPILLISIQKFVFEEKKIWLLLCFTWIGFYHSYYVFVYTLFCLMVYVHLYSSYTNQMDLKKIIINLIKYLVIIVLGSLLSAVVMVPNLNTIFSSARVTESNFSFFSLGNLFVGKELFFTIISRFFSSELLGYANSFTGWQNTLEAPILYSGLITLLFVSIATYFLNKKEKIIFYFSGLASFLYLFFPIVTSIINASYGMKYKTSAFFITIFLVFYTSLLFDRFLKTNFSKKILKHKMLLAIRTLVPLYILGLFTFYINFFQITLNLQFNIVVLTILLLLVYSFWVNIKIFGYARKYWSVIFFAIIITEICIFGFVSIQKRISISHQDTLQIFEQSNDLKNIIDSLNATDNSFFRIEKDFGLFGTGYPNDAAALSYTGTGIYHSFNSNYFAKFMESFEILDNSFHYRFFSGFDDENISLRRLLGVKYYITNNSIPKVSEYTKIFEYNNYAVWKDEKAISFGTIFHSGVTYSEMERTTIDNKKKIVLKTIFIPDAIAKKLSDDFFVKHLSENDNSELKKNDFAKISHKNHTSIFGKIKVTEPGIFFIPLLFSDGWHFKANGISKEILEVNYGFMGVYLDKGEYDFELIYIQPYLLLGGIITVGTILLIGFIFLIPPLSPKLQKEI